MRMAEAVAQRFRVRIERARDFHEYPLLAVGDHQNAASSPAAAVGQTEKINQYF